MNLKINNHFDLKHLFKTIYKLKISSVLVEGGKNLISDFLKYNFINQFYVIQSNKSFGKNGKKNIRKILKKINKIFRNKKRINGNYENDKLFNYY